MTLPLRARLFLASAAVAGAALTIATIIIALQLRRDERASVERHLSDQAVLVAELLARDHTLASDERLDDEADRLAAAVQTRITLIAADGRVVGDSTLDDAALEGAGNHLGRPEVALARDRGIGLVESVPSTVESDMLYVAVPMKHPRVAYVRVARPLTPVATQLRRVGARSIASFALAAPFAVALAWIASMLVRRRVKAVAAVAQRYRAGDVARPAHDYGDDELGTVARLFDESVQELGRRLQELSRDRARMEATLTGMVEGVLMVDRDGRLQTANRAAQAMLRMDPGATGRHYLEVIRHPDISAQLGAALRGEDAGSRELSLGQAPDRVFASRATPVAAAGGGGAVLVLHDITDLRTADQVRRDFVANVSHELRTPLTAIRGYAEALLDDPDAAGRLRTFVLTIAKHSQRMERLVADLLRLARLDAHQEAIAAGPCDLRQLFEEVVGALEPAITAKRHQVTIDVPPDAATVVADGAKLHDIVRNLVENAVNYSDDGAEVRLSAARQNGAIAIAVSDSGPGIPPADLARVFERFYRVDRSRARQGGTGLGLAIVKHLVELHGGQVRAENRPEGGACFTVTLPART